MIFEKNIGIVTRDILNESKDPDMIPLSSQLTDLIIKKSDGMILWATLATRHLLPRIPFIRPCNMETISKAIKQLPSDVEKLYAHLLQRCFPDIENLEIYTPVLNILRWVLWSTRLLRVDELEAALHCYHHEGSSTAQSSTRDNATDRLRFQITNLCYPLISIQQDDTVTIVHLTFKYFVQHWDGSKSPIHHLLSQLSETESSHMMAQACLQYLNSPRFQKYQNLLEDIADSAKFDRQHCFFDYAALGWIYHWNSCSSSHSSDTIVASLFHDLIRAEQGLTWLEGYQVRTNMSLAAMKGLQAEVNCITGSPGNQEWLLSLLQLTLIRKQGIFGKLVDASARHTAIRLASLYHDAGHTEKAKDLYNAVLLSANSESEKGGDAVTAMNNLALVQLDEGNFKDAEINLNSVVEARKQKFGESSLLTGIGIGNLACVYTRQRRFKEAEPLLQRAIQIKTAKLGKYHPQTVSSSLNIIGVHGQLGRLAEAKKGLEELVERFPQQSSYNSPLLLSIKHRLAGSCARLGEYQEAAQLHLEVLQQRTIMLGEVHRETLESLNGLAFTYLQQTRYKGG